MISWRQSIKTVEYGDIQIKELIPKTTHLTDKDFMSKSWKSDITNNKNSFHDHLRSYWLPLNKKITVINEKEEFTKLNAIYFHDNSYYSLNFHFLANIEKDRMKNKLVVLAYFNQKFPIHDGTWVMGRDLKIGQDWVRMNHWKESVAQYVGLILSKQRTMLIGFHLEDGSGITLNNGIIAYCGTGYNTPQIS